MNHQSNNPNGAAPTSNDTVDSQLTIKTTSKLQPLIENGQLLGYSQPGPWVGPKLDRYFFCLRESLGVEHTNLGQSIELLEAINKMEIGALVLIQNPDYLITIRQIRRYVGNLRAWNLTPAAEATFKQKSKIVRDTASEMYKQFKKLYNYRQDERFWEIFLKTSEELKIVMK